VIDIAPDIRKKRIKIKTRVRVQKREKIHRELSFSHTYFKKHANKHLHLKNLEVVESKLSYRG
jgi:hypothetical protein